MDTKILTLLDFDEYIKSQNLKEVKNSNIFGIGTNNFDTEGLWSEIIFGRVGSKVRKNTFGYISLNDFFINPIVFKMIKTLSDEFRKILLETQKYTLLKGKLIADDSGETGVLFLSKIRNDIKFEDYGKKEKIKVAKFLDENKDKIFINKYLIMPAGIRDMNTAKRTSRQFSSEINDMYKKVITLKDQMMLNDIGELRNTFAKELQKTLNQVYLWVQNRLPGKQGVLRGSMLKKSLDYSGRLVAAGADVNIPLGYIGIPWHTILTLYRPFFFNYIFKKNEELREYIKKILNIPPEGILGFNQLKELSNIITKTPEEIEPKLKELLIQAAKDITSGKDILFKRDPVVSRTSYQAAEIIVLPEGRGIVVNPLVCEALSLDFDGDQVAIIPVFTKQALEEARLLNPKKSKSAWTDPISFKSHNYHIQRDAVATIFGVTRE